MHTFIIFLKTLCEKVGISLLATIIKGCFLGLFKKVKNKKTPKPKKQTSVSKSVVTETITEKTDTIVDIKFFKTRKQRSITKTTQNNSKDEAC